MKQPILVTIDPEWPIAYVQYLSDDVAHDGSLVLARDDRGVVRDYSSADKRYLDAGVLIDVAADDEMIGFEIFDIRDAESVAIAREYAAANALAFPADIRAVARVPAA